MYRGTLPAFLKAPENRAVLEWLAREGPSAHSDLVEELTNACHGLDGVDYYCPDPMRYAWVVAYGRSSTIFAVAIGMLEIWLRLPPELVASALAKGATLVKGLGGTGESWVRLSMFSGGGAFPLERARLEALVRVAYEASPSGSRR